LAHGERHEPAWLACPLNEEHTVVLARGNSSRRGPHHSRLTLERLEDRCLLSGPPPDGGITVPDPPPRDPTAATVRKDQSTLTDKERKDFVDAVLALKNKYEDGSTTDVYDEFVLLHQAAMTDHAIHDGAGFFPWHRALLDLFERELQTINPRVTIPYWNWAVDNQATSSIWNSDFMGGDGDPADNNVVKTGPFRQGQWALITDGPDLRRSFGVYVSSLPTAADEEYALTIPNYDVPPYDTGVDPTQSFRNFMAGWNSPTLQPERHNRVHNWVGGSMLTEASPNDPVFWLVHANLDRIWANWEALYGNLYPESGAADGENLYDQMPYLGVTPASVLDHHDLGYRYDTEGPGAGPLRAPAAGAPGGQRVPVLGHAAHVGLGHLLHQHQAGPEVLGAGNGAALLKALGGDSAGGHAGHAATGGIAAPDFGVHFGSGPGQPGVPGWAHAATASVDHASATGDSPQQHKPG
jgi:tyrosinase